MTRTNPSQGWIALAAILLAPGLPAAAQEGVGTTYSVELRPQGSTEGDGPAITVTFEGKLYEGDWWLSSIANEKRPLQADEQLIVDYLGVNRSGTAEDVLTLWQPEEREEVAQMVLDPQIFEANRSLFVDMTDSAFVAKLRYGAYTLFFIQHDSRGVGSRINAYPVKEIDGAFYVTNELQADPVFQYFTTAYIKTLTPKAK